MNGLKLFYKTRRYLASYFTYNCAACQKPIRGGCLCQKCANELLPAEAEENRAHAYHYCGAAKEVMLNYKFGENHDYCRDTLCLWLLEAYGTFKNEKIDFAVAVPSYHKKKTRLYDLAKEFCAFAKIPFAPSVLKKIRETKKQHKLSAEERKTNLSGAFKADSSVCGKNILLIDDIYTTGYTAFECSKALYEKGAAKVFVLTVLKRYLED